MRFDIEGFITFDTEDASLVNLLTGDNVELSQTSSRLLTALLNHRGDVLSRSEIFQAVFDKYGARASNSNLNQYISTLRRNMSDLGIEKEIIVTVPRIGFKIADDAIIHNDREYQMPCLEEKRPERATKQPGPQRYYLFIKVVLLAIAFLLLIINPQFSASDTAHPPRVVDQCAIFMPPSLSLQDVKDGFGLTPQHLDCSTRKKVYIYQQQMKGTLGNFTQLLLIECAKDKRNCVTFYIREKKNA